MISIYFGAIVCCICTYAVAVGGYPQFYYMVPAPVQQTPASTYYSTPFGPNPSSYSYETPGASFVSRSFGPSQAYYTTHQTFGSLGAAPPLGYHTFRGYSPNGIVQPQPSVQYSGAFAQVPATTVFSTGPTDQFRGFAYHTQSTNGASANVFFLTGPEAHQVGNLQTLMSKISQNNTGSQIEKAKKLASDTVDSNATEKNQQQQIVETLNGPPKGPAFDAIRSFFANPQVGFQQFYASNGQLFSKSVENQNFPASTVLLPAPISIQAFGNFGLNPRFGQIEKNDTQTNATSEKPLEKPEDKGEDVAESMIADIKVKLNNDVATAEATNDTIIDSTTETVSSSTAISTEASKEEATTKKDAPTVKEARSIKQESSTIKEEPSTSVKAEEAKQSEISESTTADATPKVPSTTKAA